MCYWKGNFRNVTEELAKDFLVAAVAYTGFDEEDKEDYQSVTDETRRIEKYVTQKYGGHIRAAYGCSLGGTFVAHLVARKKIQIDYGIIGSSDMDQAGKIKASLMAALMIRVTWNFIHTGKYRSKLMQKKYEHKMDEPDPYNKAFVAITGRNRYDMSFISKESLKRQFKSDLTTPLPKGIYSKNTEIHIFYAKKMGEKYLKRYKTYFKNPIIHEQDMRHEEFLGVYPKEWCRLVKEICL